MLLSNMSPTAVCTVLLATLVLVLETEATGKALDINDKLPYLIDKHPEKSWLVKFYAPWCYHCQQLEPIFNGVAGTLHQKHDDLVVARVDCTKWSSVCEKYFVDCYPTIAFLNTKTTVKYKGDRSESSMVAFADRLLGPDINSVQDCNHLKTATNKHGLLILSNMANSSDEVYREFESLASEHKSNHWFYHHVGTCKEFIHDEGLYLLKRDLDRPIKFSKPDTVEGADGLKRSIVEWLNKESFPVFGQISYRNFERALNLNKLLVVAVLDEYKPARKFMPSSNEFYKSFGKLSKKHAQNEPDLLFGWISDRELVEYITISPIPMPNVILLKNDLSYHVMIERRSTDKGEIDAKVSKEILSHRNIEVAIKAAKDGKLVFSGGDNYLFIIMRFVMGSVNKVLNMYRANPLLMSLLFGFPSILVLFIIYTTCINRDRRGDDEYSDDDENDDGDDDSRHLLSNGHLKQD